MFTNVILIFNCVEKIHEYMEQSEPIWSIQRGDLYMRVLMDSYIKSGFRHCSTQQ